jgi:thermitase
MEKLLQLSLGGARRSRYAALLLALVLPLFSPTTALPTANAPMEPTVRILVKPKPEAVSSGGSLRSRLPELHYRARQISRLGVEVLEVPRSQEEATLRALAANPAVGYAERDQTAFVQIQSNSPYFRHQWHLPRVGAPQAWQSTTGRADQVIAIIDTGVNERHPDLRGRVLPGYNFIHNNYDTTDDNRHGTMVAGVAAARGNNGIGVAGVAWDNWILPLKVADASGMAAHSDIAAAITYAADNGARVINVSLGGRTSSRTMEAAVAYAASRNCIVVAAAGNNGGTAAVYPAAYSQVLGVAALNRENRPPAWATTGRHVFLSAPGTGIITTTNSGSYGSSSGSSFASPIVAGTVGLILAAKPELSPRDVADILMRSSVDLGASGYDLIYGHGMVNAGEAVRAAQQVMARDTSPPFVEITAPANSATVSRTLRIDVDSHDNVGVVRVDLFLNNQRLTSTTHQAFTHSLNTTTLRNGRYSIRARAYDAAGNSSISSPVTIRVRN